MMRAFAVLLVLSVGCASAPKVVTEPTVAERKWAEERDLPPDPGEEELPEGLGPDFPPEAVEVGQCSPDEAEGSEEAQGPCPDKAGILISEQKAARIKLYQIRYKELRKTYEADRSLWRAHRELYETKLELALKELKRTEERAERSWWEKHDGTIGLGVGVVVGSALAVGIAAALDAALGDGQ